MGTCDQVSRRRLILLVLSGVLSILLAAISPTFAQGPTGTILGTVKDASGGVVPEAKITVQSSETGASRTETSGPDGIYRFSGVPIGHYNMRIEKDGFKTLTQTGLVLDVDQELALNVALEVGTSAQEVVVTGEAPLVNTTTSSLGGLVNEQRMAELPLNGRNYVDLTLIQAGVNQNVHPAGGGAGAQGTWFSSNGAPPRSNNFTLDGTPLFNQYGTGSNSEANTTLGVDGIREFKLVTNMFSAEYGLRMGSQMVMVSKSGTNNWHGDLFEYLRNSVMDARNFFDYGYLTAGAPRLPEFQRNNFGGSAGGPIRKDKTFFYLVYEGVRERQGDTILDTTLPVSCHNLVNPATGTHYNDLAVQNPAVPAGAVLADLYGAAAGTTSACGSIKNSAAQPNGPTVPAIIQPLVAEFPLPNLIVNGINEYTFPAENKDRVDYTQLRVDQNISAADTFFTRFTFDDSFVSVPYTNVTSTTTGTAYPQFHVDGRSRNQWLTLGENHIFSPTLLNSVRVSWARTNFGVVNIFPVTPLNPFGPLDSEEYVVAGVSPGSGVTALSPATNSPAYHVQNIGTLGDDAFKTAGKHSVKFGVLLNMFQESNFMAKGSYSFPSLSNFMQGYPQTFTIESVNPAYVTNYAACVNLPQDNCTLAPPYNGNAFDRDFMFKTFGFYVQDDWQLKPRLTLNLGLRYEFQGPITELYGRSSAIRDFETSTTAVVGPLMDNPTYKNFSPRVGIAWDVFGTGKTSIRSGFGVYYDVGNIGSLLVNPAVGLPPFALQSSLSFPNNNPGTGTVISFPLISFVQSLGASIGLGTQMDDYNMKQPHALQYNLTVEQQLPWGVGLSLAYVGTRGINLYTDVQGDPVLPTATCAGQLFFGYSSAGIYGCPTSSAAGTLATSPVTTPYGEILPANTTTNCFNTLPECRTNPAWGASAAFLTSASNSWYNGVQVVATKRLSSGLQFQAGYTFSKSLDTTTGGMPGNDCSASGAAVGVNPQDVNLDKGPSCSNVPNSFHFNYIYHLPGLNSDNFAAKITQGWWLGGILTVNDGFPFTPGISADRSQSGSNNCSIQTSANTATINLTNTVAGGTSPYTYNYLPYNPSTVILGTAANWYNPLMFTQLPIGFKNTCSRDSLSGPNERDFDFSINKDTKIKWLGENGGLQFRAEIFNIFNRVNLGVPNGTTYTVSASGIPGTPVVNAPGLAPSGANFQSPLGTAGQITTTQTNSRQIQLALKVIF